MPQFQNPFGGLNPIASNYLNEDPGAGWGAYLGGWGGGSDPFTQWLRNQQNRYYTQYKGENAKDPNLTWTGYLSKINPQSEYSSLDPWSRGERPTAWQGRTRWSL